MCGLTICNDGIYNLVMGWFNYYGLAVIAVIMIPNIIYAVRRRGDSRRAQNNRAAVVAEQIGRYGCIFTMIFNIPYTYFGFWFDSALAVYIAVNGGLCVLYLIFWIVCWNREGMLKALALSVIPTCIFLFSGIAVVNIPLIVFAIIFGAGHIYISLKNITV